MMTANVIKIKRNLITGLSQTVHTAGGSTKAISEIWNHFAKIGNDQVRCCNCGMEMPQGANSTTKTMWCHLMYKHKNIYASTRHYYIKQLQRNSLRHANKAKATAIANSNISGDGAASHRITEELLNEFDEEDFEEESLNGFMPQDEQFNDFSSDVYGQNNNGEGESNGSSPSEKPAFQCPTSIKTIFKQERDATESPKPVELCEISGSSCNKEAKDIFNLKLLKIVGTHPALYDHNHKGYKSNEIRIKEWYEVAEAVGQPVEFARIRWKTLRDRFKKECRKQQQSNEPSQWLHFVDMMFLAPFVRDRPCSNDDSHLMDEGMTNWNNFDNGHSSEGHKSSRNHKEHLSSSNSTNYILDFAMNVVANGKSPVSADSPECNYEEILRPKIQSGSKKSNSSGNGKNGESTATVVTTTLEKPFKFENFYEKDQNRSFTDSAAREGLQNRKRMYNQSTGRELGIEEMQETAAFWNERQDHYPNNVHTNYSHANNNNHHAYEASISHFNHRNSASSAMSSSPTTSNNNNNTRNTGNKVDEEEDELFCKIMLKKLKKMSEHQKEKCKAKVLDLLVQFQYGDIS